MRVRIFPSLAKGTAMVPPSKSMAHRALISAALAEGESEILGISASEDMLATMDCLRALGANFFAKEIAFGCRVLEKSLKIWAFYLAAKAEAPCGFSFLFVF